ncbi:MAG: pantoate--beta-alanine ligase [Planctomycetota bacterium]
MQKLTDAAALKAWRDALPSSTQVALVPTMGALHVGHHSLLQHAAKDGAAVIASIFVNPLQFEREEDLTFYPRTLAADLAMLEDLGVAAVYMPSVEDLYPQGFQVSLDPGPAGATFEGAARPGHFAGMLTVVHKLFARCRPHTAWFGEKDAQQLFLVRRMAADLDMGIQVHACPTYREEDGLAYSSRNVRLGEQARQDALVLSRALQACTEAYGEGERNPRVLESQMRAQFEGSPAVFAYADVITEENFVAAEAGDDQHWRAVVAARLDGVHLLDNRYLGPA